MKIKKTRRTSTRKLSKKYEPKATRKAPKTKRVMAILSAVLLVAIISSLAYATYFISEYNWNDDFETGGDTFNSTFWTAYGTGQGPGNDNFEGIVDYGGQRAAKLFWKASPGGGAAASYGLAVLRTNFNFNSTRATNSTVKITFEMNGTCDLSSLGQSLFFGIDISQNNTISATGAALVDIDGTSIINWSTQQAINNTIKGNFYVYLNGSNQNVSTHYVSNGTLIRSKNLSDAVYFDQPWIFQFRGGLSADELSNECNMYIYNFTVDQPDPVMLGQPIPNQGLTNTPVKFNVTSDPADFYYDNRLTLVNATFFVWNSTNGLINVTTKTFTGNVTNTTEVNITNLATVGQYKWNALVCATNASQNTCRFDDQNNTFFFGVLITGEAYRNITTEGSNEFFQINLTIPGGTQVTTANLIWNNTIYNGSIQTIDSQNYSIVRNLIIPNFNVLSNVSWYWNISLQNGFNLTTQSRNQTVQILSIDNCSVNNVTILQYTMYDEGARTFITPSNATNTSMDINVLIAPYGTKDYLINYSGSFRNINPVLICIPDPNVTYRMDVTNKYSSVDRVAEYHNIQNFTLTNNTIPQNISLYDLATTDSQEFKIIVKDDNYIPLDDALIDITREYLGIGQFLSIEVPKTDSLGNTIGHFVPNDEIYTIYVKKEGTLLAVFNNVRVFCANQAIGDCVINLNVPGSSIELDDLQNKDNLTYSLNYNQSLSTVSFLFSTTDGSVKNVNITTTLYNAYLNQTICNDDLTSSAGQVDCVIPTQYANSTVYTQVFVNNDLFLDQVFNAQMSLKGIFGATRYFLAFAIVLTFPLLAISSGPLTLVFFIIGLIMAAALFLIDSGGIIGTTSVIVFFIVGAAILIFKAARVDR